MRRMWILLAVVAMVFLAGCQPSPKRRARYVKNRPDMSQEIKTAILEGHVIKGMTKDDVLMTWGTPREKHYFGNPGTAEYHEIYSWGRVPGGDGTQTTVDVTFRDGKVAEVAVPKTDMPVSPAR